MDENGGKESRSIKFRNYAIGLGSMTALILGVFNYARGEPEAEKTWTTLRKQVNALTRKVNKLGARVVFLQAHEEGRTAGKLEAKLEAAEKKISLLEGSHGPRTPPPASAPTTTMHIRTECKADYVLAGGRCRKVPRAVAKKIAQDEVEKVSARRRLEEEKRRRIEAERRKKALMKKMSMPEQKPLPELPEKLDEAAK
jgi:hypothetical protein